MKRILYLVVGLLYFAAACTETLIDEHDPQLKSGVNNPLEFQPVFHSELVYRSDVFPSGDGWAFENMLKGAGIAKHMGKVQMFKNQVISGPMDRSFPYFSEAITKYVSASKDTLCFRTSGLLYPDPELGLPHLIGTDFQAEFLYGTGRFVKAKNGEITRISESSFNNELGKGSVEEKVVIYF